MKFIFLSVSFAFLVSSVITSCKKEDERDKFTGQWEGRLLFDRIGTEYHVDIIITKSPTNHVQILIGQNIATVNGDSYSYQEFKSNLGVTGNYTGSGKISGNQLNESGLITSDGAWYQGDLGGWYRYLERK